MLVPGIRVSEDIRLHCFVFLTQIDITERAASDLATDTVLVPHAEVLPTCQHLLLLYILASSAHVCLSGRDRALERWVGMRTIVVMIAGDLSW